MHLVDDPSLLPRWLPRPGAATVADHVPLDAYPEVVRLPLIEPPGTVPTWPQPLEAAWSSLRLCDVLDAPPKSMQPLVDEQTTALVRLLLPEPQRFSFLIAETSDEVEWFVRHGRLGMPPGRRVRRRRLRRALRHLAVDAGSVSDDAEVARYWLAMGSGPRDAEVAMSELATAYLWTDGWLLRLHGWREEHSMLVAGTAGIHGRLEAVGLPSWVVGPAVPWPPACRGDHDRHFGLVPDEEG